jgi:flagellar basal body-associated protein FliL
MDASTVITPGAVESATQRRARPGSARGRRLASLLVAVCCAVAVAAAGVATPAFAAGSAGASAQVQTTPSLGFGSTTPTVVNTNTNTIPVPNKATTTASTTNGSSSFSSTDGIVIGALAVLVFGGICGYIWWDSRRHAPKGGHDREWDLEHGAHSGSKAHRTRKLSAAEKKRRKRGRAPSKRRK